MTVPRLMTTYRQLVEVIRARIIELEIAYDVVDDAAGLQSGYTAKLLSPIPIRRMSPWTQFLIFDAIGLTAVAVPVEGEAFEKVRRRLSKRRAKRPMLVQPSIIQWGPDSLRLAGVKGAAARNARMSAAKRTVLARRAARVRWRRHRANGNGAAHAE